ncbi:MAG: glucose-1-phosphate cytidylyltransferase [Rickettsiales bacterium]|nr:glucose-1-phosphate cytidylyltransferase [Rickettsiales bacterium]
MKTIILAGGFGTRLSEETDNKPKPMVEVGGRPILWHIMKIFASQGLNEFVVAMGYKADYIKRYFVDYIKYSGNLTVKIDGEESRVLKREKEDLLIHLEDTGLDSGTGGRIKKLQDWVNNERFIVTYGDGVSNVYIDKLIKFHESKGKIATITAVRPPARYGGVYIENGDVNHFTEKPQTGEGWINGGFMVFEPEIFNYISDYTVSLESDALEKLARDGQLSAYQHEGFWQCMDTLRDLKYLESLWTSGKAPWKNW